jgi:hypothetical protein
VVLDYLGRCRVAEVGYEEKEDLMHIATLGEDPLAAYEESLSWLEKNPDRTPLYFATMPQGVWVGPSGSAPTESKQLCPVGDPSDDPLIPGICNTSALVGAASLLGLVVLMKQR